MNANATIQAVPPAAPPPSDADLDCLRQVGDPIVDELVKKHFRDIARAATSPEESAHLVSAAFGKLVGTLFRSTGMPEDDALVRAYMAALGEVELGDTEIIGRGQRLFALFGPEMFLVLGSCSLPLAFAAGNGVQAIYRARRLKDNPVRRLYDTAQMIIDVMQVGELAKGQLGWRTTRKVRLIHALMRWHVTQQDWNGKEWGVAINQEDLAGTLLSFSVAVLSGLRRMGARISSEDADAYIYAWSAIGRLLGVDESLLLTNERDANDLAMRIGNRQIRETKEGKQLAEQLMGAVATLFPVKGYANSLSHFFLADTAFGQNVARILDLPPPGWTRFLVSARARQKRWVLALLETVPGARHRRSSFARRFVQAMLLFKRPDADVPFEVPASLAGAWGVRLAGKRGAAKGR